MITAYVLGFKTGDKVLFTAILIISGMEQMIRFYYCCLLLKEITFYVCKEYIRAALGWVGNVTSQEEEGKKL